MKRDCRGYRKWPVNICVQWSCLGNSCNGLLSLLRTFDDWRDGIFATPYDRLLLWSDMAGWSLDDDAQALIEICRELGVKARLVRGNRRKRVCLHYLSQFVLEQPDTYLNDPTCRYSVAYYHGGPRDEGFENLFEKLVLVRDRLTKVHVSNSLIAGSLRENGFRRDQIANIPIGIRVARFRPQTEDSKRAARTSLGIPIGAFVVGSFQKDGVGWGEGLEPKLIKGPDLLVRTVESLKGRIPELYVLLSGPARGYVKRGLDEAGVPHRHVFLKTSERIADLYQALDCYLMCSRVEGGPKSLLESMAAGVPLVATNVGQGVDLMLHGENAFVAESEDVEALRAGVLRAHTDVGWFERMRQRARSTAAKHDYLAQAPLWREKYISGFVDCPQTS